MRVCPLRRNSDGGVVATVTRRFCCRRSRPAVPAVRREAHKHMLMVDPVASVHPGAQDLIGCTGTSRRTVRDIHAWSRREVVARTAHAIHHTAEAASVELDKEARVNSEPDVHRPCPRLAPVERLDHEVRTISWRTDGELVSEDVDHPMAVGADCAAGSPESLLRVKGVITSRRDLFLRPGRAAIR